MSVRSDSWAPLRSAPFRALASARVVSVLGGAIAPVALAFAVLDLTGSATDLGIVVGARSLANVAFLLLGGIVADRLPRQVVLVGSSLAAALTQGVVAALVLARTDSIALLAALSAVNGAVSAFALPAAAALQPQTVDRAHLQQATALVRTGVSAALILGASVGGILVAAVGPGWGIALDAASFLVAAVLFARVRVPAATERPRSDLRAGSDTRVWTDLVTGWGEFTSRTWLWVVVVAFLLINAMIAGCLGVLGPLVADESVGRAAWGLVLSAQAAGYVVGGLVALRLRVRRLLRFGTACAAGEALLMLALGIGPVLPVLLVTAFIGGLTIEQFGVAWETSMQQHVPADRLARVYSYDMLGSYLAIPAGEVAAGPVAQAVGLEPTLVGAAAVVALATAAALTSRSVRDLPNTALEPGTGAARGTVSA